MPLKVGYAASQACRELCLQVASVHLGPPLTLGLNPGSGWDPGGTTAPGFFPNFLPSWIHSCLRKADKNKDNKMSFKELQNFLKELNVQVDDSYARKIFRVRQK